jgi:hypothetical protein
MSSPNKYRIASACVLLLTLSALFVAAWAGR